MSDKEYLKAVGREIAAKLPDNHGFICLTFPFGDAPGGRTQYISNARREDVIKLLKEVLFRFGAEEDWMKHIK